MCHEKLFIILFRLLQSKAMGKKRKRIVKSHFLEYVPFLILSSIFISLSITLSITPDVTTACLLIHFKLAKDKCLVCLWNKKHKTNGGVKSERWWREKTIEEHDTLEKLCELLYYYSILQKKRKKKEENVVYCLQ